MFREYVHGDELGLSAGVVAHLAALHLVLDVVVHVLLGRRLPLFLAQVEGLRAQVVLARQLNRHFQLKFKFNY